MWWEQTIRRRTYNKLNKRIDELQASIHTRISNELKVFLRPTRELVNSLINERLQGYDSKQLQGRVAILEGAIFGLQKEVVQLKKDNALFETAKRVYKKRIKKV